MECCENKNISCENYEDICLSCGTIHHYKYINEISFRDYNMNMSNTFFYQKSIYEQKNIYIIYVYKLKKLMII